MTSPRPPAPSGRTPWSALLPAAALPTLVAVLQLGRVHPDEVYQALEPAYFRAFGYGIRAWEWNVGLRNWGFPLVLSWLLELCAALGIRHPVGYRAVLALPQLLLHLAALIAAFRFFARRVSPRSALLGTLAVGLSVTVVTFAGRTLSESLSTSFLMLAVALSDDLQAAPSRAAALGGVLGLSVIARYGSIPFVGAALVYLSVQALIARRRSPAGRPSWLGPLPWVVAGGATALALLSLLDQLTWGRPLHSLFAYADFNVFSGRAAAQFGRAPPSYYAGPLLAWTPAWVWPGLVLGARRRCGVGLPAFMALVYALALFATPHKEERFLYPAIVLGMMAAVPGLFSALEPLRADLRSALAALVLMAGTFSAPAMPELRGDQLRAIVQATRSNATGLLIVNEGVWGAGGYFYLGKDIPWSVADHPTDARFRAAMADPRVNRAVTFEGRALDALRSHGFRVVDTVGRETVLERP